MTDLKVTYKNLGASVLVAELARLLDDHSDVDLQGHMGDLVVTITSGRTPRPGPVEPEAAINSKPDPPPPATPIRSKPPAKKGSRRSFTAAEKQAAAALARAKGAVVAGDDLGVHPSLIRRWQKQHPTDPPPRPQRQRHTGGSRHSRPAQQPEGPIRLLVRPSVPHRRLLVEPLVRLPQQARALPRRAATHCPSSIRRSCGPDRRGRRQKGGIR